MELSYIFSFRTAQFPIYSCQLYVKITMVRDRHNVHSQIYIQYTVISRLLLYYKVLELRITGYLHHSLGYTLFLKLVT
jgi:hypothetical protein